MTYGRRLRGLSLATVATITAALALVFFYAPLDADQGFVQKIFYIHVPLAIVSLCGFIFGGAMAVGHLRTGDRRWDHALLRGDPHGAHLRCRRAHHRLDLGQGVLGALVGLERADAGLVPDRRAAVRHLPAAALLDRGSGASGPLRERVRDRGRRVRAAELHRRAPGPAVRPPARADARGRSPARARWL